MGQYYKPSLFENDPRQGNFTTSILTATFYPPDWDNGMKLMEHSYVGNNLVQAVTKKMTSPIHLAWIGDYGDDVNNICLYDLDEHGVKQIPYQPELEAGLPFKYYVNSTKAEYVKIPSRIPDTLVIHPLPLLTAWGNGRGGGDYRGSCMDLVGRWAFDRIYVTNNDEVTSQFNKLDCLFVEGEMFDLFPPNYKPVFSPKFEKHLNSISI